MRGQRRRRGLEYEVVMPRISRTWWGKKGHLHLGKCPHYPQHQTLCLRPHQFQARLQARKCKTPPAGGAPSGDKENGSNRSGREALPVEANNPSVSTPPPPPSKASLRANKEGGDTANHGTRGTPRVEHNNPPANAPPVPTAVNSPPAGTSPPPQRGQRTRQPPAYLKDFVCDRIVNGEQESLTGDRTGELTAESGSYEHHVNIKFGGGGVGGKTTTPGVHSSALAQWTRCPAFSYADAVKGRRISSTRIQAKNVEYESKYQVLR